MYRVLLIAILLIFYGSLWPWRYNPAHAAGNPLSILLHSWPAQGTAYSIEDIVVNLLLYMPVGMFGYLALDRQRHRSLRVIGPIVLGFVLSCCIEMLQIFDQTRTCSVVDLLCNTVSAGIGVLLGYLFRQSHLASLRRLGVISGPHASGPLILVYIWAGFQTIPVFPLSFQVLPRLHLISPAEFSAVELLASLTAWLIVARLLQAIYNPGLAWRLLLLLSLLGPAKIFIAHRTSTFSELAGLAAALVIWSAGLAAVPWRTAILAGLAILVLVIQGLWPFHFSGRNLFSWVPFLALLLSPWESGLVILCHKCFWYGSGIWLLWAAGRSLAHAIGLVAALLGIIEALQIYLPGRTAEVTDPLLAFLLGSILWFVEIHGRGGKLRPPEPALDAADQ